MQQVLLCGYQQCKKGIGKQKEESQIAELY